MSDALVCRQGQPVALNTEVQNQNTDTRTNAGAIQSPKPYIRGAFVSAAGDGAVVGAAAFHVRYASTKIGSQGFVVAATGGQLATTPQAACPILFVPIAWYVGADLVSVYSTMQTTDIGNASVSSVTVFSDQPLWVDGKPAPFMTYFDTRYFLGAGAKNTAIAATTNVAGQTVVTYFTVPDGAKQTLFFLVAAASDSAAVGAASVQIQLTGVGLVAPQTQDLPALSFGGTLATGGVETMAAQLLPIAIAVTPNQQITPNAYYDKVVAGNLGPALGLTICYAMPVTPGTPGFGAGAK